MKKSGLQIMLFVAVAFLGCKEPPTLSIESLCQNEKPDGFVDTWTAIVPIDPPPPAPFRLISGAPIDLNQVPRSTTGRESQVEISFIVSMGTVGNISFQAGSAPGVMAATAQIEQALNTWQFSNNGWGQVILTLNYGSKNVRLSFKKLHLLDKVELLYSSFYSGFQGRRGNIKFE